MGAAYIGILLKKRAKGKYINVQNICKTPFTIRMRMRIIN